MTIKPIICAGDTDALRRLLSEQPDSANTPIVWGDSNECRSDPLHFVSDCVFNATLSDDSAAQIAQLLLDCGANVNGSADMETPLIGATSLGASKVALVLLTAGADTTATAVFGATALHWAAYMGCADVVDALIKLNVRIDDKCVEFTSTPLFWAVQGFSQYGPQTKTQQVQAAAILIEAGADLHTRNIENVSLVERSRDSVSDDMTQLLITRGAD